MKSYLLLPLLLFVFLGCHPAAEQDYALAAEIEFDPKVIDLLRRETNAPFNKLRTEIETVYAGEGANREETVLLEPNALEFAYGGRDALDLVLQLKDRLKPMGYHIFRSEQNFGHGWDKIAVMKTTDQFDILKYRGTNGINYDIESDSLISELKRWHAEHEFEILGAGFDWMEARWINTPADMTQMAAKVYAFCPDVVEQGTGDLESLAEEMKASNELYLWWD